MESQERKREKAIRVKPRRILKILKWKLDGRSHSYVSRKLHTSTSRVSSDLNTFLKDWKRLLKFVDDVRKTRYFEEQARLKRGDIMRQFQLQMLQNKCWPFAVVPTCLEIDPITRRLERTPEGDSTLVKIFEGRAQDKTIRELHKETGIPEDRIRYMLKNPIYKGEYDWKGYHFSWPRLAIIDSKLWKRAQPPEGASKKRGQPPHGWRWVNRREIEVPKEFEEVRIAFTERVKGTRLEEICEKVGLTRSTVRRIIRDPVYKDRGIIDPKTWEKAQVARQPGMNIRSKREKDIICFLGQHKYATVEEISKELGLSKDTISRWLKSLKKEGYVDVAKPEEPGRYKPSLWYLSPKPQK